ARQTAARQELQGGGGRSVSQILDVGERKRAGGRVVDVSARVRSADLPGGRLVEADELVACPHSAPDQLLDTHETAANGRNHTVDSPAPFHRRDDKLL